MLSSKIRKTGYSICIPAGPIFLKIIYPYAKQSAENEYFVNHTIRNYPINTFRVRLSFRVLGRRVLIMKNYSSRIVPLTKDYLPGQVSFCKIKECIQTIQSLNLQENKHWQTFVVPEMTNALEHLKNINIDYSIYLATLNSLTAEKPIHGDFSTYNIALINGEIFVYDWQSACIGPSYWDEAYYIATSTPSHMISHELAASISPEHHSLITLCSAIRLGRVIRKNKDIAERLNLLRRWEDVFGL